MSEFFVQPRGHAADAAARDGDECFVQPRYASPAFVATRGERSADLLKGIVLVDKDGKKTGMNLPPSTVPGRCPHGANQMACVACYHAKQVAPKPQAQALVRAPVNPVIAAVKARTPLGDLAPGVPHVAGPVHVGLNPDGTPVAKPKTKMVVVGTMPVPVVVNGGGTAAPAGNVMDPFDYAHHQGRIDSRGLWHAPKHKSIIDSKARHPHADAPPTRG